MKQTENNYQARIAELEQVLASIAPVLDMAMDISIRYQPCGYYCDEIVGHVDHELFNWAREAKAELLVALHLQAPPSYYSAKATMNRMPIINDSKIHEALNELEDA